MTPLPGHGAGICTFTLPARIRRLLDADGDGKLTWEDQKLLFRRLRQELDKDAHLVAQHVTESVKKRLSGWAGGKKTDTVLAGVEKQREKARARAAVCFWGRGVAST